MTSLLTFWNYSQQYPQQEEQKEIKNIIVLDTNDTTNFLQELKNFQKSGKLKKTMIKEYKAIKTTNKVWEEIMEKREKILGITKFKETLEEKVERLEKELENLRTMVQRIIIQNTHQQHK